MFGDKEDAIGPFNTFGGLAVFTSTLCKAERFFCGEDFQSPFLGSRSESVERGFGACNGVDRHGIGGSNEACLVVASVSGWVTMWR